MPTAILMWPSFSNYLLERIQPITTERDIRSIIKKIVFNPKDLRFEFELDNKFWSDVRSGRIVYIPGLASRLYYVTARKTWLLLLNSFKQVNWRWDPEWSIYLPKGYEWIADEESKYRAVKEAEPKIDDRAIIRYGRELEKEHQADIEASLEPYFKVIDEIIASSPVYRGVSIGNEGPLPVSKRKLLAAARAKDPKSGFPAVAWGWAKHRKQLSHFEKKNRPGMEDIKYRFVREGMAALADILSKPDLTWVVRDHANLGRVLEIRYGSVPGENLGPGAWFSDDGSRFISFLDPLDIKGAAFRGAARALDSRFPEITAFDASAILAWWLRKKYGATGAKKVLRRVGGMVQLIEHLRRWRRLNEMTDTSNVAGYDKGWQWEDDEEPSDEDRTVKKGVSEVIALGDYAAPIVAERLVLGGDSPTFFRGRVSNIPRRWLREHEADLLFDDRVLACSRFLGEYIDFISEAVARSRKGRKADPVVSRAIGALISKGWYHSRSGKRIDLSSEIKRNGKVVATGKAAKAKHAVAIVYNIKKRKGLAGVREFLSDMGKKPSKSESFIGEAERKHDPKAALRNRPNPVFPSTHSKVTDDKDHFPLGNIKQARNALARAAQYSASPGWWGGSLDGLKKAVRSAVKRAYPSIEVSK